MNVASLASTSDEGASISLGDLCKDRSHALVFLRHFGCIFCRYQVAQLRSDPHLPIHFVCQEGWQEAKAFRERMRSPHPFLSDPTRSLYDTFGFPAGTLGQHVNFHTLVVGARAMSQGIFQGKPTSNPTQLGGLVVLSKGGEVNQVRVAKDAADIVTAADLRTVLQEKAAVSGKN